LLVLPNASNAQPRDPRYQEWGREVCARVQGDLTRAERDLRYLSEDEVRRFNGVRARVGEFDRKWERGRFDREDLDEAIGSLARLVERARLRPRDRDLLADDLRRLRGMRERFEHRDRR
jgi:hypothetical protein